MFSTILVLPVFAQEGLEPVEEDKPQTDFHFLFGLDVNNYIAMLNYQGGSWDADFRYSPLFFINAEFQLPINSDFKTYLGIKAMSVLAVSNFQLVSRFGYAFEKPQNWNKYHVELLGTLSAGIWLGLIEYVSVQPCGETSFQVYLMPDKNGFFVGLGPQTTFLLDLHHSLMLTFGMELSAGFKF